MCIQKISPIAMSDEDKLPRRKILAASGTALTLSGIPMNAAASDRHQGTTPERIGETKQIAVHERDDGLFLYDKRDLSETGQIHAYAGPKPEHTTTAINDLDESQLEQLIDYYSDPQKVQAEQDEASTMGVIPGVSAEIGGDKIGESDVIDAPEHGIYLAIDSPGLPYNPGIELVVDLICTLIDEFRGSGASGAVQPAALPVAKIAAALKALAAAYSCSLIFEPLAYAILDGDATMVFHDEDWFYWQDQERVPAIMNATENDYITDDPWDEVATGLLIAPANMYSLLEYGETTVPGPYVWGDITEPN